MRQFAELFRALDATTKTNAKVDALVSYLSEARPEDAVWAVALLRGERPRRPARLRDLREWAAAEAGLDDWLFDASYHAVGDLAETLHLVLPDSDPAEEIPPLHVWCAERLPALRAMDDRDRRETMLDAWRRLAGWERFAFNKLITGGLRVGVSKGLVERAVARHAGLERDVVAHRLMGDWPRTATFWSQLVSPEGEGDALARPYPYFLASPLSQPPAELGGVADWQVEWKWDGIRAQLVRRGGECFVWSRGEDLVNTSFPDVLEAAAALPEGTVLDGELLAWRDDAPLPFQTLQRRLRRKKVGAKLRAEVPVRFVAYDLLEIDGDDCRSSPLTARRAALERVIAAAPGLGLSTVLAPADWEAAAARRDEASARGVEGLMLKRKTSPYRTGRKRGDWFKWKVAPHTLDAVLLYAQAGHGRRASLYTDYTFGLWSGDELVTFAKAYSGLSDEEIRELDRWIKHNTLERFGPVRAVPPAHVFEVAFEGAAPSKRHKSGVAVRFPRIVRWRRDKSARDADTLAALEALVPSP